jgi:hypothetical protein
VLEVQKKLISINATQKVAQELLHHESAIIPDATSRKVIGKVGGVMAQVGGKIRALTFLKMGNETRDNWADLIVFLLEQLSTAADCDKQQIWAKVCYLLSDQHGVNKEMAVEIAKKLGLDHTPGQLYCNVHPVLQWDDRLKKVWQKLQVEIGAEKLFPSLSVSNLNEENYIVVLQLLEGEMSFIAPDKSHKSWCKYFQFCKFLEEQGRIHGISRS